jgi:hypothetical protein
MTVSPDGVYLPPTFALLFSSFDQTVAPQENNTVLRHARCEIALRLTSGTVVFRCNGIAADLNGRLSGAIS